jgi:hypothetical protein
MAESRYISQAERARRLIDNAVAAWQRLQGFAMEHDELIDSLVLRGQELWLPHHETEGRKFRVTLVVELHYPPGVDAAQRDRVQAYLHEIEREHSDSEGSLAVKAEVR